MITFGSHDKHGLKSSRVHPYPNTRLENCHVGQKHHYTWTCLWFVVHASWLRLSKKMQAEGEALGQKATLFSVTLSPEEVLYGDTDSMFVRLPGRSKERSENCRDMCVEPDCHPKFCWLCVCVCVCVGVSQCLFMIHDMPHFWNGLLGSIWEFMPCILILLSCWRFSVRQGRRVLSGSLRWSLAPTWIQHETLMCVSKICSSLLREGSRCEEPTNLAED